MKSKNTPVTLQAIGELIDQKLDQKFDQKLAPINSEIKTLSTKVVGIYGELYGIKQQISSLNGKVSSLDSKLEEFRKEVKANFVGVYDGMSSLADTLDQDLEPRIKNLETRQLFA